MKEIWKIIKEYPDYEISNFGRIKSFKYNKINGKILKSWKHKKGHLEVELNGKHKKVHILLFETFNNYKLKDNECIHHIDENKENNIYENLELLDKIEHTKLHRSSGESTCKISYTMKEKFKNGELNLSGENNPRHKLTEEEVTQIKLLLKEEILTQKEIADVFGVSRSAILAIKLNKSWKHVTI